MTLCTNTAVSFNGRTSGFQPDNDGSEPSTATKLCARCHVNPRATKHSYCKECRKQAVLASYAKRGRPKTVYQKTQYNPEYYQKRYRLVHEQINTYKMDRGCMDCGYDKHFAGLEFDHLPRYQKLASPVTFAGRGWKSVLREIEKCDVVCGTCHNIRTWKRRNE